MTQNVHIEEQNPTISCFSTQLPLHLIRYILFSIKLVIYVP